MSECARVIDMGALTKLNIISTTITIKIHSRHVMCFFKTYIGL